MLALRTTTYGRDASPGRAFEPSMFTSTNAFRLSHENGFVRVDTAQVRTSGMRVGRVQSTGHLVDLTEDHAATFLFPRAGRLRVRVAASEFRITPQGAMLFAPNSRRTQVVAPSPDKMFDAVMVMTPLAELQAQINADPDTAGQFRGLSDGIALSAKVPGYARLSDLLSYISQHFSDRGTELSAAAVEGLAVLIEELMRNLIMETTSPHLAAPSKHASLSRVRQAEDYMRSRSDEPLSMAEVAREVGVGLRSLQLAFVEARAMGPRDVLNRMRLERAYERLKTADETESVTTIALDCGFSHLSRFACAYRIAFGESPSETLAKGRRAQS